MEEEAALEMDSFLEYFSSNHRDDNFSTIKYGNYEIKRQDFEGEVLDWTLQYLQYMSCPASLEAGLAKAVLDETKLSYLNEDQTDGGKPVSGKQAFTSLALLQNVTVTVSEVCRRLKKEESYRKSFLRSKNLYPCSSCAIRNGRKKMEDRHIIIHDLNNIFKNHRKNKIEDGGSAKNGDEPEERASFYGVFDGHVGKDAAAFTAAHLHQFLLQSEHYPADPVKATFEAYHKTNTIYEKKAEKEDKAFKCGTTVVFTLILGRKMYISWLGDSQVLLVRNGSPVKVVTPHKPDRKDEQERIARAGGNVIFFGEWRVNGLLAVSRSIGDFEHRTFISAEPDVTSVDMNGTEDFVILASDGLWDYVVHEKVTAAVYDHLIRHAHTNDGEIEKLSLELANLAKQHDSVDNISVVVVFLKPVAQLIQEFLGRSEQKENKKAEEEEHKPSVAEVQKKYSGITSTCKYISQIMSTGEETTFLTSNVKEGAFSSPGGGGMTFGGGSFSPDGRINDSDENEEQFRRASDSMFKEGNDFMSNADNAWMQPNHNANNPFLADIGVARKPDSGFISPACNSSNKSSDEDRKEDEEFLESQEVSKLLGGRPMEQFLGRDSPTPPVDENGSSLEEILAVARDNPDSVGDVDDDDSDESSTDDSKPAVKNSNKVAGAAAPGAITSSTQNISDSDENDEGDFTFVKEGGHQVQQQQQNNLLSDIHEESPSVSSDIPNGHHPEEEDEEGPSSVIIESQEAPKPDSASFILKTSSSAEAPDLPSPQEPVVEMIMEPEGVGNASPILEEIEEEDRSSLPSSPHKNKAAAPSKEASEMECGAEEEELTGVSFKCADEESDFVLKTPNPNEQKEDTHSKKEQNQPNESALEEKNAIPDTDPVDVENSKNEEAQLVCPTAHDAVAKNLPEDQDDQEIEEIVEEVVEFKHVATIGGENTLPPSSVPEQKPVDEEDTSMDKELPSTPHEEEKQAAVDDIEKQVILDNEEKEASNNDDSQVGSNELQNDKPLLTDAEDIPKQHDNAPEMKKHAQAVVNQPAHAQIIDEPMAQAESNIELNAPQATEIIDNNIVGGDEIVEGASPCTKETPHANSPLGEEGKNIIEPIAEPVSELIAEPVIKPVVESITAPIAEPVTEPIAEPTVEPVTECVAEPSVIEPIAESAVMEPTVEPVMKPIIAESKNKKAVESKSESVPSSTRGSPKKEAKGGAGTTGTLPRKPLSSATKSATSSPKKTASSATGGSSARSTLSKRPSSSTAKANSTLSKTTPKAPAPAKPSSASRLTSANKTPGSLAAKSSSTSTARPSSTKTTNSALTKKPMTGTTRTATSSSGVRSASTRPSSGEATAKSKVDSSRKDPPFRTGSITAASKPATRVGKSSTLAASSRSASTTTTTSASRKPLSSRTTSATTSTSSLKKSTASSESKIPASSRTTGRPSLQGRSTAKTSTTAPTGARKPTGSVAAKVSTGLARPKSASTSKTLKPSENGAAAAPPSPSSSSPKASPINGNESSAKEEAAVAAVP